MKEHKRQKARKRHKQIVKEANMYRQKSRKR